MERTNNGTRALTTELKYLNLDPSQFQHLPEEDDDDGDMYYGIEKGYEHLVEYQEPEEIWQDADDPERTESAKSEDDTEFPIKTKKLINRKTRKALSSEDDSDPLSLVAEAKREEKKKKERPHSKERSKERKRSKSKPKPKDPLDMGEQSTEKKKEKEPKKREKRSRKKKEKEPPGVAQTSSLSSLIGMKITKHAVGGTDCTNTVANTPSVSDSDYDSQGKCSVISENNETDVLFDGLFSMDELKSPEKSPGKNPLAKSLENYNVNGKTAVSTSTQPPSYDNRMDMTKPALVSRTKSRDSSPSNPTSSLSPASQSVKESLTKLLHYRRQKTLLENEKRLNLQPNVVHSYSYAQGQENPIITPQVTSPQPPSASPVNVPEKPKVYMNQTQSEQLAELRNEVNSLLSAKTFGIARPVIQYSPKSNNSLMNNAQTSGVRLPNPGVSQKPPTYKIPQSPVRSATSAEAKTTPSRSHVAQTSNGPKSVDSPSQQKFHIFLKELQESINAGADVDTTRNVPVKKEVKPMNRVTPVTPAKPQPKTSPQCAKTQKKSDNFLNTFSRLSYLHKNKMDTKANGKNVVEALIEYQSKTLQHPPDEEEINRIINEQKAAKAKYLSLKSDPVPSTVERSPCPTPRTKQSLPKNQEKSKPGNAAKQNPIIANILQSNPKLTIKPEPVTRTMPVERPRDPPTPTRCSSLTERDQQDLLLLLRQQTKLNNRPAKVENVKVEKIKERVQPPQTITNHIPPLNYSLPSTSQSSNKINMLDAPSISYTNIKQVTKHSPSVKPSNANNIDLRIPHTKPLNMVKTELNCTKTVDQKPHSNSETKTTKNKTAVKSGVDKQGTDWEKVMDAILSHKTPSRGPNALDMALNKDAYDKSLSESLRKQRIVKVNSSGDARALTEVISRGSSDPALHLDHPQRTHTPIILSRSNTESVIKTNKNKTYTKSSQKVVQKSLTNNSVLHANPNLTRPIQTETTKRHIQTEKRPSHSKDQIDVLKKIPNKHHEKQFTASYYKEEDPFISGIPNSDYDLLEELMDDDLRQEIGELSSDEDSYRTPMQGLKDKAFPISKHNITPAMLEEKLINPSVINSTPVHKKPAPKARCDIPKTAFHTKLQQPESVNVKSVIKNPANLKLSEILHQQPKTNEQILNINPNQMRNVDQANTFVAAVPQQPAAKNVVIGVIGSDLVYQHCTVKNPPRQASAPQSSYVAYNKQPNVAVYQTTQFAAPVVKPLIIGNAVTVPAPNAQVKASPLVTLSNKPEITVQTVTKHRTDSDRINKEEIRKEFQHKTTQNASKDTKPEPKSNTVETITSDTQKVEKEKVDINSNKNVCERKVLSEVQEKQKLASAEKTEPKITRSQSRMSFERDMVNEVLKDQERLQKKRLSIINRNISHRIDKTVIPLTYAPLIIKPIVCKTQEKRPKIKITSDVIVNKIPSVKLESVNIKVRNGESLESNTAEKPGKTVSGENFKENKDKIPVRRILLRSSNKDLNLNTAVAEKVKSLQVPVKKLRVRLKPTPRIVSSTTTATVNNTVSCTGANLNKIIIVKKRSPKKIVNKTIKKTEIKKKPVKIQPKRNAKVTSTELKTQEKSQTLDLPSDIPDLTDLEEEILTCKIPKSLSGPVPPLEEIPNVEEILGNIDNDITDDAKSDYCSSPSILEKDNSLNPLLCNEVIDTPDKDVLPIPQEYGSENNDSNGLVLKANEDEVPTIIETVKKPSTRSEALKSSDLASKTVKSTSNNEIMNEIESYIKKLEDRIKDTAETQRLDLECKEIMFSTDASPEMQSERSASQTPEIPASQSPEVNANQLERSAPQAGSFTQPVIKTPETAQATAAKTTETNVSQKNTKSSKEPENDDIICLDEDDDDTKGTKNTDNPNQRQNRSCNTSQDTSKNSSINTDLPKAYMDSIQIEDLPHLNKGDPTKKCVRIKLPCGKVFKATVHGQIHVDTNTLFMDPALRAVLLSNISNKKRYTLNVKQMSTSNKSNPDKIVESRIQEIRLAAPKPKLDNVVETIDLLSDSDEDSPKEKMDIAQHFNTEFGKYKVKNMEKQFLENHQKILDKKCVVKLKRENLNASYNEQQVKVDQNKEAMSDHLKSSQTTVNVEESGLVKSLPPVSHKLADVDLNEPAAQTSQDPVEPVTTPSQPVIQTNIEPVGPSDNSTQICDSPMIQTGDKPMMQSVIQPVIQSEIRPVIQSVIQPVKQSVIQSVVQSEIEPVKLSVIQPAKRAHIEPVAQTVIQPVMSPVDDSDILPVIETAKPVSMPEKEELVPPVPLNTLPAIQSERQPDLQFNVEETILPDIQSIPQTVILKTTQSDVKHIIQSITEVPEAIKPILQPTTSAPEEVIEIDDSSNDEDMIVPDLTNRDENTIVGLMLAQTIAEPLTVTHRITAPETLVDSNKPVEEKIMEFKNLLFKDLGIADLADNSSQSGDTILSFTGAPLATESDNSVSNETMTPPILPECFVKLTKCDELVRKYENLKMLKKCFIKLVRCDDLVKSFTERPIEVTDELSDDIIDMEDHVVEDAAIDVVPLSRCGSFSILADYEVLDALQESEKLSFNDRSSSPVMAAYETIASLCNQPEMAKQKEQITIDKLTCQSEWLLTKPNTHLQYKNNLIKDIERCASHTNSHESSSETNQRKVMPLTALVLKLFEDQSVLDKITPTRLKKTITNNTKSYRRRTLLNLKRKSLDPIETECKISKTTRDISQEQSENELTSKPEEAVVNYHQITDEVEVMQKECNYSNDEINKQVQDKDIVEVTNSQDNSSLFCRSIEDVQNNADENHDQSETDIRILNAALEDSTIEVDSTLPCVEDKTESLSSSILHEADSTQTEFYIENDKTRFEIDAGVLPEVTGIVAETISGGDNIISEVEVSESIAENCMEDPEDIRQDNDTITLTEQSTYNTYDDTNTTKDSDASEEILVTTVFTELDTNHLIRICSDKKDINNEAILDDEGKPEQNTCLDIDMKSQVTDNSIFGNDDYLDKEATVENITGDVDTSNEEPELIIEITCNNIETLLKETSSIIDNNCINTDNELQESEVTTENIIKDAGTELEISEAIETADETNTKLKEFEQDYETTTAHSKEPELPVVHIRDDADTQMVVEEHEIALENTDPEVGTEANTESDNSIILLENNSANINTQTKQTELIHQKVCDEDNTTREETTETVKDVISEPATEINKDMICEDVSRTTGLVEHTPLAMDSVSVEDDTTITAINTTQENICEELDKQPEVVETTVHNLFENDTTITEQTDITAKNMSEDCEKIVTVVEISQDRSLDVELNSVETGKEHNEEADNMQEQIDTTQNNLCEEAESIDVDIETENNHTTQENISKNISEDDTELHAAVSEMGDPIAESVSLEENTVTQQTVYNEDNICEQANAKPVETGEMDINKDIEKEKPELNHDNTSDGRIVEEQIKDISVKLKTPEITKTDKENTYANELSKLSELSMENTDVENSEYVGEVISTKVNDFDVEIICEELTDEIIKNATNKLPSDSSCEVQNAENNKDSEEMNNVSGFDVEVICEEVNEIVSNTDLKPDDSNLAKENVLESEEVVTVLKVLDNDTIDQINQAQFCAERANKTDDNDSITKREENEIVLNKNIETSNSDSAEIEEVKIFVGKTIDDLVLINEKQYIVKGIIDVGDDKDLAESVLAGTSNEINESVIQKPIKYTNLQMLENNSLYDDSGSVLRVIEYEDEKMEKCYLFPVNSVLCDSEYEEALSPEENIIVTQQLDEDGQTEEIDIKLNMPKRTYSRKYISDKKNRKNLKRKVDMTDVKVYEKKYRKGKNIDYPKITIATMGDSAYSKEFKRLLDYCSSVTFSYSRPFHKEYIDVHHILKSWPIQGICNVPQTKTENDNMIFRDTETVVSIYDPSKQTLADEINTANSEESDYVSYDINETNFNMGFGEGSGRVIQNLEDGCGTKFSAATLSDVKQTQPLLLSENYGNCVHNRINSTYKHELDYIQRNIRCIQMREKVRSFFKKTMTELTYDCMKEQEKGDYSDGLFDSEFPYGLTDPDFMQPAPFYATVQVVQVGQLPVSAAAQNPVTCDPRVTQVSNVSPSQCSAENSPSDDPQSVIKTEYTELTTADLSMPLAQEYVQHIQSMPVPTHEAMNYPMGSNYTVDVDIKPEIKIEMEEAPEIKEEVNDNYENSDYPPLFEKNMMNNVDYSYERISSGTDTISGNRAQALVNMLSQKLRQGTVTTGQASTNNFQKTTSINAMALQQALAQILPPPLNQTNGSENNQQTTNTQVTPQVLHIVQGKSASGNHQQITLVDNTQQSVINAPNATPVLHIVQNKTVPPGPTSNGTPASQTNSFSGLSLVDGIQQGNQLLHIVNAGNQKNANTGQLLKRVNLLTNLTNVQGGNEQKMVQFVCKSADGKPIQLNGPHQRSMVLRLQPVETPNLQPTQQKQMESQEMSPTHNANSKDSEIKSRSVYEENYAKFIQSSSPKTNVPEKGTSLPKFNQAFGKQVYQDGGQKSDISNGNAMSPGSENPECQANDNAMNLDHITQIGSPPLLLRKTSTSQAQPNLVQQIKQTISPMNIHGGVIYTRQIPVNLPSGQTINLITVPSSDLIDESNNKQQGEMGEPSIIKIVPQTQTNSNSEPSEENNSHMPANDNAHTPQPQPQPVLTQMRIKLPMLSKAPQMVSGGRLVRPSFFQIQRNVISGTNQPVYQQLVLTAAPQAGQQTIRLPAQAQTTSRPVKATPSESQSSTESMSSSTLEQLREFDLVLEQVKERSTVQPTTKSKSKKASKASTETASTSSAGAESSRSQPAPHKQHQVLYSIGNTQPLNVAYVNRKASGSTSTPTTFVRSPDSSGIADSSPSSSSHSQIPHTVTSEPSTSDAPATSKSKSGSKSKSRPKASSNPPNTLKLNTTPPKPSTQKPAEDEQTTQRILYILAEYKEQVENSPDKDKPAPRRRTNPPSNPGSSKRKKSSSYRRGRDMSPIDDSCRTMGSEDSSCGTSQGDCNDSCVDSHSPQDSPRKVVRKLTFEQEAPPTPQPRPQPQRNVIVADGQTITVARGTAGKPSTAVLMPANYILPVSMIKGGQQIAIVTNRGPKLLTVGGGEGGATNALLLQRLIGPAGLKPVLTRPGVRHVRLPTAALHNLQAFNLATATTVQPPDSTASPAPAPTPPELVETRANSSPWRDREAQEVKPERGSSPEGEPWHLPATADPHDYSYEEVVRTDNMDRTVLDPIPDRYSPDMEAQRIFDKMFDVDSKKSYMVDSHDDSPRCGYDIDASDCDDKAYHQVVQKKSDGSHHRQHRLTHVSAAALRHKYAILEHELRLQEYLSQKSLSEECEDLGVDSPSASELFPEAELLFAASPAHDHTQDHPHHSHTPQPLLHHSSIPQPDMDDQIATDQLLPRGDLHDERQDLAMGLDDVGIVTVSEDGMQATIALDQEEFARSHPNTTFHSEPTDDGVHPPSSTRRATTPHKLSDECATEINENKPRGS
ncbi:hypothetical protein B5X24_HaOG216705 [Helicoverpa armigera]|nr:hypothetical protein B5X24_HaOG216705 [Helicoverpa armigera]